MRRTSSALGRADGEVLIERVSPRSRELHVGKRHKAAAARHFPPCPNEPCLLLPQVHSGPRRTTTYALSSIGLLVTMYYVDSVKLYLTLPI